MTNTLYSGIQEMQYVALAANFSQFKRWCSRWQVDSSLIPIATAYGYRKEILAQVEELDSFSLILFPAWDPLLVLDSHFISYAFTKAINTHDTEIIRPYAIAGYIRNWKMIYHRTRKKEAEVAV